ncbi:MAG: hypothetical protein R3D55_24940 [Chloroflexota bacterium]
MSCHCQLVPGTGCQTAVPPAITVGKKTDRVSWDSTGGGAQATSHPKSSKTRQQNIWRAFCCVGNHPVIVHQLGTPTAAATAVSLSSFFAL